MGVIIILLFLVWLIDPMQVGWHCRFNAWSGLSCPTCGLSRSLHDTMHLDLLSAFRFHILGPVLVLIMIATFVRLTYARVTGREVIPEKNKRLVWIVAWVVGLVWVAYWLVRLIWELAIH